MQVAEKIEKLDAREARLRMYRDLILEAAEREFAGRGFEHTKVQDIAATADLSLATLYNSFRGKDDIYEAIHEKRSQELVTYATAQLRPGVSELQGLLAGMQALVEFFVAHPNYLRIHLRDGISWASESGIAPGRALETWTAGIRMLSEVVERGIAAGELVKMEPRLMAQLMVATMQVWLSHWVEGGMRISAEALADDINAYLLRCYARPQS